jgi:hypothetical protein
MQDVAALADQTRLEVGRRAGERLPHQLKTALDRGQKQLLLRAERAEHERLRHAHAARDAIDRGAVQAGVGELVHGRIDERLPALDGRDALAILAGVEVVAMARRHRMPPVSSWAIPARRPARGSRWWRPRPDPRGWR